MLACSEHMNNKMYYTDRAEVYVRTVEIDAWDFVHAAANVFAGSMAMVSCRSAMRRWLSG